MIIDYLLLVNEFEKAAIVMEKQDQLSLRLHPFYASHINNLEVRKLQRAIIAVFTGKERMGKKVLKEINPELFWYFEQKYNWIRYLLLQLHFIKTKSVSKKKKLIIQIEHLIADTGFTYFNNYLKEYL